MSFHVSLVGRKDLRGEIYRQLRRAIVEGRLRPGDSLPATRELARSLGVSRTTVTVAYDRLVGEGFVTSRVGAGTFVSDDVRRQSRSRPAEGERQRDHLAALRVRPVWSSIELSTAFARPARYDFRSGLPDASLFPHTSWRRLMSRELRSEAVATGVYGHPAGYRPLREAIARHVGVARAVVASADEITITSGTQQALDIIARLFLGPGERVAVEDPGYWPAHALFASLGANVVGMPVDREGLVVDALPRNVRLVYVTPSHQYPLGVPMSLPRRLALLAWAQRHDAVIVEDDYDSEFRFGGRPIEPLQTIDPSGRVIYIGSFSKTMLPTLRLGFLVAPPSIRDAVVRAKFVTDWHTSLLAQATLARFIDNGSFARHLRKMNRIYGARRDLIVQVLTRDFADHLEVVPSVAGLHIAALARSASVEQIGDVVRRAADVGVAVQELARFAVQQQPLAGVILGYGAVSRSRITEGLARLRACFD